jgi:hypothetical protein
MALTRFRIEAQGSDEEEVENLLDFWSGAFIHAVKEKIEPKPDFECTDERISAIHRNGIPMMYGRRVFKVVVKNERS